MTTVAVVLDIEGTTSPTSSVRDVLFSYTRARISEWLRAHRAGAAADLLVATAQDADRDAVTEQEATELLCGWLDADIKAASLKTLQGLICHEGFVAGELYGQFFPDVPPALHRWHEAGVGLYVYSSGSVDNQRDWFVHAEGGRLDDLIGGYFDLASAGSKRTPESYQRITTTLEIPPSQTLFLSDAPAELTAAVAAGWTVCGVTRPGEPHHPQPPHRWVRSFDEIEPAAEGATT